MMYYRRKIILALLQQFGGRLNASPFHQLLFLFTRRQQDPDYEFIPYTEGPLSLQARSDRATMVKYEWLKDSVDWHIITEEDFIEQLEKQDQQILQSLHKQFKHADYKDLITHTHREYPFHAINSERATEYLDDTLLQRIESARPSNNTKMLYTIGYEGVKAEAFMNTLVGEDIRMLVDVRKNSRSMKFGFNKSQLQDLCDKVGMAFLHIPELGIAASKRKNLESEAELEEVLEEYERETLPNRTEQLQQLYTLYQENERVALTCYEKEPDHCHRLKISEYLYSTYDVPVGHL